MRDASGWVARRLIPAVIAVPLLLGGARHAAVSAGRLGPEQGSALLVAATVVLLAAWTGWTVRSLGRAEARRVRELAAQQAVTGVLAGSESLEAAIPRLVAAICDSFGWEWGAVWRVDAAAACLRCVATGGASGVDLAGFEADSRARSFERGVGLPGRVWRDGKPAWIPDVARDANFPRAPAARAAGLHGAFAFPVRRGERVLGVLEFFSREVRAPDGELLALMTTVGAQVGQFIERKQVEEERDRFFTLSLDLLCIAGLDGYFKRINPAFERTLGYSTEELLARPFLDFVHPDDVPATLAELQRLGSGACTISFENRYRARDGSWKWLEWAATPLVESERVYAAARDVSERKRSQEALTRAAEAERRARESLERTQAQLVQSEKLAALGQMVAGVAHEVNNPLAYVSNNLAVLREEVRAAGELLRLYAGSEALLAEQRPALLARIRQQREGEELGPGLEPLGDLLGRTQEGVRRIQGIVEDLREFARLDTGGMRDDVDLNEGIDSTLNIVRGRARKAGIELESDLAALPSVPGSPARLNQVVLNLLANAIDACGAGGRVRISTRALEDGVEVAVEDTGCGIDPSIRDRLFDPFFTTKPPGQGTGLGLSISYGIVQDHAGRMGFTSQPGCGSRFTVWLPRRPVAPGPASPPEAA